MRNAFWRFRNFCVYAQTVPDSLHLADIGIWQAIIVVVLADCKARLFNQVYLDHAVCDRKWEAALDRLRVRLSRWTYLENRRLASWVAKVGEKIWKVSEVSRPLFNAAEYRQLMLVSSLYYCPYYCPCC